MERELNVHMSCYLLMKEGETKEQAEERFYKMFNAGLKINEVDVSYQIYEMTEQKNP